MDSFRIIVQPSAERELRQSPFPFRRQIIQAIHKLKKDPYPEGSEAITDDFFRLTLHGWRIVYGIEEKTLVITIYRITQDS